MKPTSFYLNRKAVTFEAFKAYIDETQAKMVDSMYLTKRKTPARHRETIFMLIAEFDTGVVLRIQGKELQTLLKQPVNLSALRSLQ